MPYRRFYFRVRLPSGISVGCIGSNQFFAVFRGALQYHDIPSASATLKSLAIAAHSAWIAGSAAILAMAFSKPRPVRLERVVFWAALRNVFGLIVTPGMRIDYFFGRISSFSPISQRNC
jgi:hypothetical protein